MRSLRDRRWGVFPEQKDFSPKIARVRDSGKNARIAFPSAVL